MGQTLSSCIRQGLPSLFSVHPQQRRVSRRAMVSQTASWNMGASGPAPQSSHSKTRPPHGLDFL